VAGVGSTFTVELPGSGPAPVAIGNSAPDGGVAGTPTATVTVTGDTDGNGVADTDLPGGAPAAGGLLNAVPAISSVERDAGGDAAGAPGPGRAFRVLLVENNLTTLDLVERVLSRRPGTEVLAAMQGGLGVDLAREHVPDMILLDFYLPDMTGDVVLDRLAEDPATADIPVAVIGADAPAQQVRQLLGRGVMGFLAKPIDVRGLLSLVDAVRASRGT
jgi:CheY-like chemotaxis protein